MGLSRACAGRASPPLLYPFPTRSTLGFLWSPCPSPPGPGPASEVCLGMSGLTFSPSWPGGPGSPISPCGRTTTVTLQAEEGDSCHRAALPVPGVLRRHGHAWSPFQGEVPNTERVLGPPLVRSGARTGVSAPWLRSPRLAPNHAATEGPGHSLHGSMGAAPASVFPANLAPLSPRPTGHSSHCHTHPWPFFSSERATREA